ncbi:MAG TPA: hypothetical protein VGS27_34780 [Candidatus Sulfotelmatobacter sp.]|nr:hypothetical protein [Candidatus Sulfotelmatobacter sp.]
MSRRSERNEFEQLADSGRQPQPDTVRRPESDSQERGTRGASSGAAELQRDHLRDSESTQRRPVEPRTPYRDGRWAYSLRTSEIQTLRELGTFRAIDSEALAEISYRGERDRMEQDLRSLIRQSLITRRRIEGAERERMHVLTLTKAGQRFLRKQSLMPKDRPIYYGLVKLKEACHDATLYRLYHKAACKIDSDGGKVRTVALDYELKKRINRELSRLGTDRHNGNKKIEIAQAHGVRVVNGRVVVPDLQIEYENAEGQMARVNLELATKNYRAGHLQAKAQAGFTLYAPAQDSDRLRRVLNGREITAEILSL